MTPDALLAAPAVRLFALVSALLVLKMMLLGLYTTSLRLRRKVFATPEDYAFQRAAPPAGPDEDVERARRAHQNDLENILPFLAIGFFYALTGPSMFAARIYFWGFLTARVLHTFVYVRSMQPHRTIAFTIGYTLMFAMLVTLLVRLA